MHFRPNLGPRQPQYSKPVGVTSGKSHNLEGSGVIQPQDIAYSAGMGSRFEHVQVARRNPGFWDKEAAVASPLPRQGEASPPIIPCHSKNTTLERRVTHTLALHN